MKALRRDSCGQRRNVSLALLALTVQGGCAIAPPISAPLSWEDRRAQLATLERYAFRGRIAAAYSDQGFSGALRWRQDADTTRLQVDGPLGIGALSIEARPESLRVATGRGERLDGAAARAELEQRLGFELPLGALRYWMLGVAAPDSGEYRETLGAARAQLVALEQQGWRIAYTEYMTTADGALPRRIVMTRDAARLRVIVDRWDLP